MRCMAFVCVTRNSKLVQVEFLVSVCGKVYDSLVQQGLNRVTLARDWFGWMIYSIGYTYIGATGFRTLASQNFLFLPLRVRSA